MRTRAIDTEVFLPVRLLCLGVFFLLALTVVCAPADAAPKTHKTLEVMSGADAHEVELNPVGSPPTLVGATTFFVRLKEQKDPNLYIRFAPERPGGRALLCAGDPRLYVNGKAADDTCHFEPFPIEGEDLIPLRLKVVLPSEGPLGALSGSLILGLNGKDEGTPIPIKASPPKFDELSVNPESLTLNSDNPDADVTLSGADLVQFLRASRSQNPSGQIRSSGGDATTATIELPTAKKVIDEGHPRLATATVTLSDSSPPPGKYTGKVPLSDLAKGVPSVEIDLHSHRCFGIMLLLIIVGVVVGGLLARLFSLAMRRSLLLRVLEESVAAYRVVRTSACGEPEAWRMDDLFDEDPLTPPESANEQRLQGLPALRASIKQARSNKDLDEDAQRVLDMVTRIQRWLRVEPAARLLAAVGTERSDAKVKKLAWDESQTVIDTAILLEMAKREPRDSKEADDLVRRLLEQAKWHHRFVCVWDAAAAGKSPKKVHQLVSDLAEKDNAEVRKADVQDVLDARLDALVAKIKPGQIPAFPKVEAPKEASMRAHGITPVNWDTGANNFTGWATLDGPSLGQLSRRAATSARSLGSIDLRMEMKALNRRSDAVLTFAAIGLASAAYGLTGYSDTWGSCEDMWKAALAGATGAVVIDWGAMPLFQSVRLRSAKKD